MQIVHRPQSATVTSKTKAPPASSRERRPMSPELRREAQQQKLRPSQQGFETKHALQYALALMHDGRPVSSSSPASQRRDRPLSAMALGPTDAAVPGQGMKLSSAMGDSAVGRPVSGGGSKFSKIRQMPRSQSTSILPPSQQSSLMGIAAAVSAEQSGRSKAGFPTDKAELRALIHSAARIQHQHEHHRLSSTAALSSSAAAAWGSGQRQSSGSRHGSRSHDMLPLDDEMDLNSNNTEDD